MTKNESLLDNWRSGKAAPVYVLHGEEEFLRTELLHAAPEALVPDESTRSFNFDLLYGPETTLPQIVTMAQGYPMMAERRLVIVREAERILRPKIAGEAAPKNKKKGSEDPLLRYLEQPNPSCTLIFDMEKFGARNQSPFKELSAKSEVIEFSQLKEGEVVDWLRARATGLGRKLPADAARLMVGHLGISLHEHANELEKLVTYTTGKSEITTKDVEQVVGASREHNVFELTKAIGQGNKPLAVTIALRMLDADSGQRQFMFVMLARFIEQLIISREMAGRGEPERAIAEALEMRGGAAYFVKDTIAMARRYTSARLDAALRAIVQTEADTRAARIDDALLIETLLLKLLPV